MRFPLTMALATAVLPAWANAQDPEALRKEINDLKNRVDELEEQQAKTSERIGGRAVAQAYTAKSLDLGGHVTSLFTHMRGENDRTTGHVTTLLELFLKAQLDDHWSLFATPGFYTFNGALLDDPNTQATPGDPLLVADDASQSKTFLSRMYGQWKLNDQLQVQGGIIGSPHGTTNREYFIPARTIGQGSLHTRVFLANMLYPQQIEGAKASGKLLLGAGTNWLDYDAYFGVEDDSPGDGVGGARLAYVFGDWGLSVAANYGRGTREGNAADEMLTNVPLLQSPFAADVNGGRDYQFFGIDVDWRQGDLIAKTEAYISAEGQYRDRRAFSTEWTYFLTPQWGLSYRFDYFDAGSDQFVVSLSPFATMELPTGHATEHVVGVCYNPNESVRLRLDLHHELLPRTDDTVDFVNFSWSISF